MGTSHGPRIGDRGQEIRKVGYKTVQGDEACAAAIAYVAPRIGTPRKLLEAVGRQESGRTAGRGSDRRHRAWAWTLNIDGEGHYFPDYVTARNALRRTLAEGTTNVDVGCMQISMRWNGKDFADPLAALDPLTNVLWAARRLRALRIEKGSWTRAAGFYHSPSAPERQKAYVCGIFAREERRAGGDGKDPYGVCP